MMNSALIYDIAERYHGNFLQYQSKDLNNCSVQFNVVLPFKPKPTGVTCVIIAFFIAY